MKSSAMKTFAIIAVALLLASAIVGISMNGNTDRDEGDKGITYTIDVTNGDNAKIIIITADRSAFNESISLNDITIYYACMDQYVTDLGNFDTDRFYNDLSEKGKVDKKTGEKIPYNTEVVKNVTDFKRISDTEIGCTVSVTGTYGFYMFHCEPSGLIAGNEYGATDVRFVIPEAIPDFKTPWLEFAEYAMANTKDPVIKLKIFDAEFNTAINTEDITLSEAFCNLIVKEVIVSEDKKQIDIKTEGDLFVDTCLYGGVEVSANATSCGQPLFVSDVLLDNAFLVDFSIVDHDKSAGTATMYAYFSANFSDIDKSVLKIDGRECKVTDVKYIDIFECYTAKVSMKVNGDIDKDMKSLYGKSITVDDKFVSYANPVNTSIVSVVTSAVKNGDNYTVTATLVPFIGNFIKDIKADNFEVRDDVKVTDVINEDGIVTLVLDSASLKTGGNLGVEQKIIIKNGITSSWDTPVEEVSIFISYEEEPSNSVLMGANAASTEEMVKALYDKMNTDSIFSGIGSGLELIGGILELTGVIEVQDPYLSAIESLRYTCEEMKSMLAIQNEKLNEISSTLNEVLKRLDELKKGQLSNAYSSYVNALNQMNNDINNLSRTIKVEILNNVINGNSTFHIYVTEDGQLTVMRGDYTKENTSGMSLNGKRIDFSKTIKIDMKNTFKEASTLYKYIEKRSDGRTTKNLMTQDLEKMYTELKPSVQGTPRQLAEKTFDLIVYCIAAKYADGNMGNLILNDYRNYVQVMASLNGDSTDSYLANPVKALNELIGLKYNFYGEAKEELKNANMAFALNMYKFSMMALLIDDLSSTETLDIQKLYSTGMAFLKNNTGAQSDDMYCYVTKTKVKATNITVKTTGTYHCKNSDWYDNQVVPVTGLGMSVNKNVSKYVNKAQMKEIVDRFKAINPNGNLREYLEGKFGKMNTMIITGHKGLCNDKYKAGENVLLKSWWNNILSGESSHAKRVLKKSTDTVMGGTITNSTKYECKFDEDMYGNFCIHGSMFNIDICENANVRNAENIIFAVGYVSSHHSGWSYDEAQFYSAYPDLPNSQVGNSKDGKNWTFTFTAYYSMLELY